MSITNATTIPRGDILLDTPRTGRHRPIAPAPQERSRALPRVDRGALLGAGVLIFIVACSALIVLAAADRPSLLSATSHPDFFPGWMAGPLGGLWPSLTRNGNVLRYGVSLAMIGMYGAFLLGLRYVPRLRARWAIASIVAVHLIFFLAPPMMLTDIFNYINYGRMEIVHHLNPYTSVPVLEPHLDPSYSLSNWHQLSSPYGPLFTFITFAVVPLGVGGSFWALKALLMVASLTCIMLVWKCARLLGRDPIKAIVFVGLNPIVLMWGLGGDHNDFVMLVFIILGFYLLLRSSHARGHVDDNSIAGDADVELPADGAPALVVLQNGPPAPGALHNGTLAPAVLKDGALATAVLPNGGSGPAVLENGAAGAAVLSNGGSGPAVLENGAAGAAVLSNGNGGPGPAVLENGAAGAGVLPNGARLRLASLRSAGTRALAGGGLRSWILPLLPLEIAAGAAFTTAVAIKASGAIILPAVLGGLLRHPRRLIQVLAGMIGAGILVGTCSVIAFGPHLPSLGTQGSLVTDISIPNLLGLVLGQGGETHMLRTILTLGLVLAVLSSAFLAWRWRDSVSASAWASIALIATLSWVLPWYVLWVLPLAALSHSRRLRVATLVLGAYLILAWIPISSSIFNAIHFHPAATKIGQEHQLEVKQLMDR